MKDPNKIKYFLYARKSSEAEDRQVASIDAQISELKNLATENGLQIIKILSEAKSAKEPGRPVFNQMLELISSGDVKGIICWKLDRLSRNPVDSGRISWMLQRSEIKHIYTFGRNYYPADNVLMMAVEQGMANQFINYLSINVKRGFRKKWEAGQVTGIAPSGYLNTPDREKGTKTIIPDPERFQLVRRMWDLMLTGNYTVMQILNTANNKWNYRTIKRRKEGGGALSLSTLYKIFTNTFYYGEFERPLGSGNFYPGEHKKLITKEEFMRVQALLGRKGKHAPHTRTFAFTGLMRCGDCGCLITAEEKNQIICPTCKHKFAYERKKACPKCETLIEKMKNPKILHYVYYHCTKRKQDIKCTQSSVLVEDLEQQIHQYLGTIGINQKYLEWALKHLKEKNKHEAKTNTAVTQNHQQAYKHVMAKIDELLELRLSKEI